MLKKVLLNNLGVTTGIWARTASFDLGCLCFHAAAAVHRVHHLCHLDQHLFLQSKVSSVYAKLSSR